MSIEGVALLMLGTLLLILNIIAIGLYKKANISFWVSGFLLLLVSYPLGLFLGSILIKIEQHTGGLGTSAAFLSILFMLGVLVNALALFVVSLFFCILRVTNRRK